MKNLELWAVSAANGDQTAKLEIINQFRPLLRKYAYKLNYEHAFYDLELKLLEILTMPFFNNPQNTEEQIVSYIHRAIVNEYIRLNKALNVLRNRMILYSDLGDDQQYMVETICAYTSAYAEIDSQLLLYGLSESEQIAVKRIVIDGETAAAVAKQLGCTRQSVNQAKQRGLNKLKRNLQA